MSAPYLFVPEEEPDDDGSLAASLPEAEFLSVQQLHDGLELLYEDKSGYPRFTRVPSVDRLIGSFPPGDVLFAGAEPGAGKSLFAQNLMDDFIGQEIITLYIGTEQDDHVLKVKQCCIRAGVSARLILKPRPDEIGSTALKLAEEAVEHEMQWLCSTEISRRALFANTPYVTRHELDRWIRGGVQKYGIEAVIVDHIDQVDHGPGVNSVSEATGSIQLLHNHGRKYSLATVVMSQLKRRVDPMKRYTPPELQDFAGTSGKERIAAVAVGLWRPLRTDLTEDELKDLLRKAKSGGTSENRVYQPNTMGVRKLKDRLDAAPGEQVMLHVGRGGMLSDDEATTHGINTSGTRYGI